MNYFEKIHLLKNALGLRARKFCLLVKLSPPNYSQMKNGRRIMGNNVINKICIELGIDKRWLLGWQGDLNDPVVYQLKQNIVKGHDLKSIRVSIPKNIRFVPLVNQFAYSAYLTSYYDSTFIYQLPKMPFINDQGNDTRFMVFEMKGDGMNNGTSESYLERDRLYCQEIEKQLWSTSKINLRKHDYVIVHKNGIFIKRIIQHNTENHTIKVHSLNEIYPDEILNLDDVIQLFSVIESTRRR